jgi:hypothetical protein
LKVRREKLGDAERSNQGSKTRLAFDSFNAAVGGLYHIASNNKLGGMWKEIVV